MNIDRLVEKVVTPKPMLAGNLNAMMKTCGRASCDCMKENGKRHPFNQFSFKVGTKTKTFSVNKKDFNLVQQMVNNYNDFRAAGLELGRLQVILAREHGYDKVAEMMLKSFEKVKRKSLGVKSENTVIKELTTSRDIWKSKAMQRHEQLAKNTVTIRDLKASREKWKCAQKESSIEISVLKSELALARKNVQTKEIPNKKNSK